MRQRRRLYLILAAVAVFCVAAFYGLTLWDQAGQQPETRGDYRQRYEYDEHVEIDGTSYRVRQNITNILLMGIDRETEGESRSYRNGGNADFLMLVSIDHTKSTVTRLEIDRDTMTPLTILDVFGKAAGKRTAQISLSHSFGNSGAQNCSLTVKAVRDMMSGIPIDFYIAMNLDGISTLNDSVGGVTVTLEDDFSARDSSMVPGATLTLHGKQAEIYVRSRMGIGSGRNVQRMSRQRVYITALADLLESKLASDSSFAGTLFDTLSPYLTTNMQRGRIINEAASARSYKQCVVSIPGTHKVGNDGYMQFYYDGEALNKILIDLVCDTI